MGEWFGIAMKQITDPDGRPDVFGLGHHDNGLLLSSYWAEPANRWGPKCKFVFRLRK